MLHQTGSWLHAVRWTVYLGSILAFAQNPLFVTPEFSTSFGRDPERPSLPPTLGKGLPPWLLRRLHY